MAAHGAPPATATTAHAEVDGGPHHDDHGKEGIQEEDLMNYPDRHVAKASA